MIEFDAINFSAIVFFLAFIPGCIFGMLLLRKSELNLIEKLLLSFFLGMFIVPTALYIESFLGLSFSFSLVVINVLTIISIGIVAWGYLAYKGEVKINLPDFTPSWQMIVPALLIIALLLAFWIRIQPFSPVYSELDPYWYVYGTAQVIQFGAEPLHDDTAWFPEINSSHRGLPLKKYLEAEWYATYTSGGEYNNYLLFITASWLPPIAAAMLCFGAYLLISSLYGRKYGIFVAFLIAMLPISIFKMSAGVNEASPISMGLLFLSLGCLAYSLVKKDKAMYLLTAFAFFITITGSTYFSVLALPFAALMIGQSIEYFVRGKTNSDFIEVCSYVYGVIFIASMLQGLYIQKTESFITGPFMMVSLGFIFALMCHFISLKMNFSDKKRIQILVVAILLALAVFFFTPIGGFIKNEIKSYVGAVDFKTALEKTIAEQNLAGDSFEGEAGFLAYIPASHKDDLLYAPFSTAASTFTSIGNITFKTLDVIFNFFIGTKQTTSLKQDSLLFVFFVIATIGMVLRHFTRKEDRDTPSVMLLILAVLIPVFYVGMTKLKFTVFAGIAIAIVAPIAIAECERFFAWLLRKKEKIVKYIAPVFICLMIAITYMQFVGPSTPYVYLIKSFQPRFQDNPIENGPIAADLCSKLKAKNVPESQMQSLCDAGKNPEAFSNTTNGQYNYQVCWLSQMTVEELFPDNSTEMQKASSQALASAQFRCNRLPDYWINSMEWMKTNLNSSDRINSWWDYGHWTNYFGNTNTVLRNEHASRSMIGRVAHDFLIGSTQDLIDSMNYFDSQYVLLDVEIIGGQTFGGKYGALNYLGCVHEGATSLDESPGTSDCEYQHNPERIVIPASQSGKCTISESQMLTGGLAYQVLKTGVSSTPIYCIGETTLINGEKIAATYYLDRRNSDGDLELSKGFIRSIGVEGENVIAEMIYETTPLWIVNGTNVDGMVDAKTDFYKSNLYRGFYLKQLPGFELVYDTNEIKIYRLINFVGNKEGVIDPIESKKEN